MQTDPLFFIISLAILVMSVVVHEVSHGFAARRLGDPTAEAQGRLTLNPIMHVDLMGSIVVPLLLFFTNGPIFGWAKPVPYNPYNLRDQKWGELKVAVAGPASNFALAIVFGLALRFLDPIGILSPPIFNVLMTIVGINLVLGIFNLIPVPPLDGSKVLFAFLPYKHYALRQSLERFGPILVLVVVFLGWNLIYPLITSLFFLITGL